MGSYYRKVILPICFLFMRNILHFKWGIPLILVFFLVSCKSLPSTLLLYDQYFVVRVIDGDTLCVLNQHNEEEKIRLIGIDAPETKKTRKKNIGYYGEESTRFLRKLILHKRVYLEYDIQKIDMYGRTLAYVYLDNGIFLNNFLVEKGYCAVATFPPNVKFKGQFIKSEHLAKSMRKGMWNIKSKAFNSKQ